MKTKLIQIGNSKGIRLPKAVIEQTGLKGAVELEVRGKQILIQSADAPRADWDEAFKEAGAIPELTKEERAFLEAPNAFEEKEWTW